MAYASELLGLIARSGLPYAEHPVTIDYTEYSTAQGPALDQLDQHRHGHLDASGAEGPPTMTLIKIVLVARVPRPARSGRSATGPGSACGPARGSR